jgi:hypothetical protein
VTWPWLPGTQVTQKVRHILCSSRTVADSAPTPNAAAACQANFLALRGLRRASTRVSLGVRSSVVMTPCESPNRLNEQQKNDYDLKWECRSWAPTHYQYTD